MIAISPAGLERLRLDESLRLIAYNDATGDALHSGSLPGGGNVTIGYGRNLSARGITFTEADYLLKNDLLSIYNKIDSLTLAEAVFYFPVWTDILVMIDYNTGNVSAWYDLIAAMNQSSTTQVAAEVRNSKAWRGAEHARYERFARAIEMNTWEPKPAAVA
jgi:hypothetical protein